MKKQFLSMAIIAGLAFGVTACGNSANETTSSDSVSTTNTTGAATEPTTATSTGNYAAMADSIEANSSQGYYLNPKTGKPYGKLMVDRSTGAVSTEAGEPVWRYVDNRNWWVYGDNNYDDSMYTWEQVGEAHMEGDKLTYKGDGDKWVDYDTKWKVSDDGMKTKMKTKDGDKIKVKTDEEGNTKIKVNGEKVKMDSAGNIKD